MEESKTTELKTEESAIKFAIVCPHRNDTIYTQAALSIMVQSKHAAQLFFPGPATVSMAVVRNNLVENFLKSDCTHALFLDGDEIFPENMVYKLLGHDKDIVSAYVCVKNQPNKPNAYVKYKGKYIPYKGVGLEEVDAVGFGQVLVKREVLEKMGSPWFAYEDSKTKITTEEIYFFEKVKKLGYKLWVDYNLRCEHLSLRAL
jgi:choline kinase